MAGKTPSSSEMNACILREAIHGCNLAENLNNILTSPNPPLHEDLNTIISSSSREIITTFSKVLQLVDSESFSWKDLQDLKKKQPPRTLLEMEEHDKGESSRRKKLLPRWGRTIPIDEEGGSELPADGYTWRKYGQKEILGAQHPRSYYRCTHKYDMGCPAMKQVQRANRENSSYFDITYIGYHTCQQQQQQIPQTLPNISENPTPTTTSSWTFPYFLPFSTPMNITEEEDPQSPKFLQAPPMLLSVYPSSSMEMISHKSSVMGFSGLDAEMFAGPSSSQPSMALQQPGLVKSEDAVLDDTPSLDDMDFMFHSDESMAQPQSKFPWNYGPPK